MKTSKLVYSVNRFFSRFRRRFKVLSFNHLLENRDGMTNDCVAYDGLLVTSLKTDCK